MRACARARVHESHYAGRTIIIFRYFFRSTQIRVIKNIHLSRSEMFHAHVKGVSERSELTPCIYYVCLCCVYVDYCVLVVFRLVISMGPPTMNTASLGIAGILQGNTSTV